jgi:superfamily II DNA or RNA helicase
MNITIGNVYSNITLDPHEEKAFQTVIKKTSVFAPGYRYTYLFKNRKWDGKVSIYSKNALTGLLPSLLEDFSRYGLVANSIQDNRKLASPILKQTNISLRDYQLAAIKAAFSNQWRGTFWPRGVISMATGGGKTHVAAAMIQMLDVPTLFIVHRKDLMYQTAEVFRGFGIDTGRVGDGLREVKRVTVATIQTLAVNMDMTDLSKFKQLFMDECHLCAADVQRGNQFVSVSACIPAPFRWGLSGTPFMKDKYSDRLLEGTTGGVVYEVHNRELIDAGYLAEGRVTMFDMPVIDGMRNTWPACYEDGIVLNGARNQKVIKCIQELTKPILVLTQRVEHGKILEKMAIQAGLNVKYLNGKSASAIRNEARALLRGVKIDAIIATNIFDEGIDEPSIRTIILAGGGRSPIKNLQRLGRGLRRSKGKTDVQLIDFLDRSTKWLYSHSRERKKLWESQGFAVKIE